jgi:hypothetical protein
MLRAETPQEQFNLIGAGRRNWVINGDMQVSQRGDYSSATSWNSGNYYMDRWNLIKGGVSATLQQSSASISQVAAQYSQKLVATSTATGYMAAQQKIEDYALFSDQTVTVSAWVKSNSPNALLIVFDGSWKGAVNHSGNGSWEKLETTVTVSSSPSELRVRFGLVDNAQIGNLSITTNDYIEVANVQLELGKVATPFEHRSYGEELALCQRYYYQVGKTSGDLISNFGPTRGGGYLVYSYHTIPFPAKMRTTPTVSYGGNLQGQAFITAYTAKDIIGITSFDVSRYIGGVRAEVAAAWNSGEVLNLRDKDGTGYISFDAEL